MERDNPGDYKRIIVCRDCRYAFGYNERWGIHQWGCLAILLAVPILGWVILAFAIIDAPNGAGPLAYEDDVSRRKMLTNNNGICPKCGAEGNWVVNSIGRWDRRQRRWYLLEEDRTGENNDNRDASDSQ